MCPSWPFPLDAVPDLNGIIDNGHRVYDLEQASSYLGMSDGYSIPNLALSAPYNQSPIVEFLCVFSKPAEFLAVRETQGK